MLCECDSAIRHSVKRLQVRAFSFAAGGLAAAQRLHERLLGAVVQAPVAFYDGTPSGRVLNRFSSDVATADDSLPFIMCAPCMLRARCAARNLFVVSIEHAEKLMVHEASYVAGCLCMAAPSQSPR